MDLEPKEWLTDRKLIVFIITLLTLYLTCWGMYFAGYFPAAHKMYDKERKTESQLGEAR